MSLSSELEKLKYDKRLMDWNVSRGRFPKEELKKYLDSLPDLAHNVDHFGLGNTQGEDGILAPIVQTPAGSNTGTGNAY